MMSAETHTRRQLPRILLLLAVLLLTLACATAALAETRDL